MIFFKQGEALYNLERYEEAITCYEEVIQIEPDSLGTWNNRGNVLATLERHEEAIASFDKALQIEPNIPEIVEN